MTFTVQSEARQHDAFAEALREEGVRVHYFGQLLGETLELPDRTRGV